MPENMLRALSKIYHFHPVRCLPSNGVNVVKN